MELLWLTAAGLSLHAPGGLSIEPTAIVHNAQGDTVYMLPIGGTITLPPSQLPAKVVYSFRDGSEDQESNITCLVDVNKDGDCGTDADILAFFAALEDGGGSADWNGDGSPGTDADIAAFFGSL